MLAIARIHGASKESKLTGTVTFKDVPNGTEVCAEINGLPDYKPGTAASPPIGPHGFHIHSIGNCQVGDPNNPFQGSGEHWNPTNQPHGNHAGDFPVLFSNHGYSKMIFFTDKFKVADILGKSIVIHENPDDYRTQPAGASGKRIGCGVIESVNKRTDDIVEEIDTKAMRSDNCLPNGMPLGTTAMQELQQYIEAFQPVGEFSASQYRQTNPLTPFLFYGMPGDVSPYYFPYYRDYPYYDYYDYDNYDDYYDYRSFEPPYRP